MAGALGTGGLDLKYLLVLPGALVVATGLSLFAAKYWQRAKRAEGTYFWLGVAAPLGSLIGSSLAPLSDSWVLSAICTFIGSTAFAFCAPWCARWSTPSRRVSRVLAFGGGVTALALGLGVGARELPGAAPLAPVALPPRAETARFSGPDLFLISLDTLRASDLRDHLHLLPHLSRLVARSWVAWGGLTPAPSAVPSHHAMLTGASPFADGEYDAAGRFQPRGEHERLATQLRDAGWRTVALINNSLDLDEALLAEGFERFENLVAKDPLASIPRLALRGTWLGLLLPAPLDEKVIGLLASRRSPQAEDPRAQMLGNAPGRRTRDRALAWLEVLHSQPQPGFLFLHYADLHQPYRADPEFAGRLSSDAPWPERYRDSAPDARGISERIAADFRRGGSAAVDAAAAAEHQHRIYLEELMFLDGCVGEVLQAVEDAGRPSFVVLTSNHGESFAEGGRMGHGDTLHEEVMRVPILISGPGITPMNAQGAAHLEDLAPTLLARCGLSPPVGSTGIDLLAATPPQRDQLAATRDLVAYYSGSWKLLLRRETSASDLVLTAIALHELGADPRERQDLLAREPTRVAAMTAAAIAMLLGQR